MRPLSEALSGTFVPLQRLTCRPSPSERPGVRNCHLTHRLTHTRVTQQIVHAVGEVDRIVPNHQSARFAMHHLRGQRTNG